MLAWTESWASPVAATKMQRALQQQESARWRMDTMPEWLNGVYTAVQVSFMLICMDLVLFNSNYWCIFAACR